MTFTREQIQRMRDALIDASPLSDGMKRIVKDQYDVSIIHRDVVVELAGMVASDYGECRELWSVLNLLGEEG